MGRSACFDGAECAEYSKCCIITCCWIHSAVSCISHCWEIWLYWLISKGIQTSQWLHHHLSYKNNLEMRKDRIMLNPASVWLKRRHTPVAHNLPRGELIGESASRPHSLKMTATCAVLALVGNHFTWGKMAATQLTPVQALLLTLVPCNVLKSHQVCLHIPDGSYYPSETIRS